MDIFAHAHWATAAGIGAQKTAKKRIRLGRLAFWGVFPDWVVFTVPAAARIWRFLSGASKSLLPDGRGPHFDWVWALYNATHSAVVFAICFGVAWLWFQRPVLEMLGWAIHILLDVFTHGGLFAVKFLWPVSTVRFNGATWESPLFLSSNYATLAMVFLLLWWRHTKDKHPLDQ